MSSLDETFSAKKAGYTLCAIACAALGFVLGTAIFDMGASVHALATVWLMIAASLTAAFIIGMAVDRLMVAAKAGPWLTKITAALEVGLSVIERRFRGDRTDEEYQRAETGIFILAAILLLIATLFLIGYWTLVAVTIAIGLWLARSVFISFHASQRYGLKGLIGWTCSGLAIAAAIIIGLKLTA